MAQQPTTALQAVYRVIALLRGDWRDIFVIIAYALGVGLFSLAFPIAVNSLVNSVAFGTLLQPVVVLTFIVGGVVFFAGALRVLQLFAVELLQRRLVTRLGLTIAAKLPHIYREKFEAKYGPEYVLRFLEVFQVQKALATLLLDGVALFFQITLGLVLVSFYHPLFLAFALVLLVIVLGILSLLGKGGVQTGINESDAKYTVASWLQDLATQATVFKCSTGERFATSRADNLIAHYLECRATHFKIIVRQVVSSLLLQTIASSLLLGLGGWLVIKGQLSLGQLVAAELVFSLVLVSISRMGKHLEQFYDLAAGVHKLDAIFDLPYEQLSGGSIAGKKSAARLRIDELTLGKPSASTPTLHNAQLDIPPGERVVIWGENGSGKSYLAKILFKLAEPTKGRIRIDDHNIQSIHPLSLRNDIELICGVELFHGSIRDNLTLGNASIDEDEIIRTLKSIGLYEIVSSFPQGLNTLLRGTSAPFSRSQALRLMVARGILMKPRLLILDGTLDLIDERSRGCVLETLLHADAPWTLLVLTHDSDLLAKFPTAYRMHQGVFELVAKTQGVIDA